MPLVSVVVPTHNRPELFAEALASVQAQTFTDYEIIVVSNGESPEMRRRSEAVAALHDVRYFALPQGNVCAARNFGIAKARGEWIAFLDDDDLWLPHKLERQIEAARRTGADMISCDYVEFYPDGHEIVHAPRLMDGWCHTRAINHLLWWANTSAVIIRRSALGTVGGFDPRQRHCNDNELWRRASWRHRIHHVEEPLFRYRQGHDSLMQRERLRYLYDMRLYLKMHLDTPRDLRDTLAGFDFFWNRAMIVCLPKWIVRDLEITAWGGIRRWPTLGLRDRWVQFRRWLRPRSRLQELRSRLLIRT